MKSLLALLEPEEFVGKLWHDFAGRASAQRRFPEASVAFEEVRRPLAVLFRGLGGAPGLRLAVAGETGSAHRPTLRQRLAGAPRLTVGAPRRPGAVSAAADRRLSRPGDEPRALCLARRLLRPSPPAPAGTVRRRARCRLPARRARGDGGDPVGGAGPCRGSRRALRFRPAQPAASAACRRPRPRSNRRSGRCLGRATRGISPPPAPRRWASRGAPIVRSCRRRSGARQQAGADGAAPAIGEEDALSNAAGGDERARKARRSQQEQTERHDYLALNRFEKMLTMAESMNLAAPGRG